MTTVKKCLVLLVMGVLAAESRPEVGSQPPSPGSSRQGKAQSLAATYLDSANLPKPFLMYLPDYNIYVLPNQEVIRPQFVQPPVQRRRRPLASLVKLVQTRLEPGVVQEDLRKNVTLWNTTKENKTEETTVPLFKPEEVVNNNAHEEVVQSVEEPYVVQRPQPLLMPQGPPFWTYQYRYSEPLRYVHPVQEPLHYRPDRPFPLDYARISQRLQRGEDVLDLLNIGDVLREVQEEESVVVASLPGGEQTTRLVLKPVAKAVAGPRGVAVASPVAKAVLRRGQKVSIEFDPDAVAVAGPGGRAHTHPKLIIAYANETDTTEKPTH